jgi:hypothetical protein
MTHDPRRCARTSILVVIFASVCNPLAGQTLSSPRYRPRDAALRAKQMVASISRLDASVGSVRRVLVDTLTPGAFWVEYEPAAMARAVHASTPEAGR